VCVCVRAWGGGAKLIRPLHCEFQDLLCFRNKVTLHFHFLFTAKS
jgi:hypothetical protein